MTNRVIVIGQHVDRVIPYARIGADYYRPGPKMLTLEQNLQQDLRWLNQATREMR